jgi:uncharacterized protein YlaN (UPF0358 family)
MTAEQSIMALVKSAEKKIRQLIKVQPDVC